LNCDDARGAKKLASALNCFRNGPVLLIVCTRDLVCANGNLEWLFLMSLPSAALIQVNGGGLALS
jgi:hypothetical protein